MKHFSLARIREAFPNFNKTPVTEEQFWRACKKFKIVVRSMPLIVDGYHERKRGRYYIMLDSRLRGPKWLHTALHEFCHYLCDVPDESGPYVLYRRREPLFETQLSDEETRRRELREKFADAVALACLVPFRELKEFAENDYSESVDLSIYVQRIAVRSEFGF